jgi:acylphosphatase
MTGRRAIIQGRVQGVFFRAWTVEQARELGVSGWVRNRRDGSVEFEAFGDEAAVEALIERCREGPPSARVERIELSEAEGETPEGFSTRPTV